MKQAVADELGRVIGEAFERMNAGRPRHDRLSQRAAADLAGIHESWWRAVVAGGQRRGDTWVPVKAAPETYIDMAAVVGVEDVARKLLGDEAPAAMASPDTEHQGDAAVAMAIRDDPNLIEEAKQHLLNQYDLLRRLTPQPSPSVARGKQTPRRAKTSDEPPLRAVARGGDPAHREEVSRMARRVREQHDHGEGAEKEE